jgi:hypothetical protein
MTGPSSTSRVRRLSVAFAALSAVALSAATSHADDPKCPPGSWFCADAEIKIGAPGEQPAPPPTTQPAPAPPPPVVIYTPAPAPPPPPPPAYYPPPPPPPPPPRHEPKSEVGLNFHLAGAAYGANDRYKGDTGAGGIGAALRFRPTPRFGLEIALDALSGKDANGFKRSEVPLSFVGLLYLNPRSKAQVYLLGGFGFSSAQVDVVDSNSNYTHRENYSYFGGIFGGGMEFRVGRKVALNFDVRGFVRGRTDEAASRNPEFTAADGRTTNTSGGALFTGGLTFYF